MVVKSKENVVGAWAFLIGVILAISVGIATSIVPVVYLIKHSSQIYGVLVILGLLVGLINVRGEDSRTFLIACTVLVVVSKFGMDSIRGSLIGIGIGDAASSIFGALLALFVPSTIVIALKTVFSITKV